MSSDHRLLHFLGAAALLASTVATTPAWAASAPPVISIAAARHMPVGAEVTVAGTVTTPSGAFESSFFDKGFGFQDGSAGIFVSQRTNRGFLPGREGRITGTLQDSSGLLVLVPAIRSDVRMRATGDPVQPTWFETGAIGESTEGLLVRVVGRVSQAPTSDLPYGYKFAVNDGSGEVQIFVNTQTGIDVSYLSLGQRVSVTGFSSQFETHYEIDPRSRADIERPHRQE